MFKEIIVSNRKIAYVTVVCVVSAANGAGIHAAGHRCAPVVTIADDRSSYQKRAYAAEANLLIESLAVSAPGATLPVAGVVRHSDRTALVTPARSNHDGLSRDGTLASVVAAEQSFPLNDTKGLVAQDLMIDNGDFLGRKAVRLVKTREKGVDGFVPLPGVDFQAGTIEADVAVKITAPPGTRMPGFIGIAFRARPDASSYDMFYVRPGAAVAEDQAARNQVVQYCAAPGFSWYALRRAWPWVYESHADLRLDGWTHIKIEVAGRAAKLYLNNNPEPTMIVDGLRGLDLHGNVSLFTFVGQEGYFSNVRITHAAPQAIKNGSDAAGTWDVKISTDAGNFAGTLQLRRDGNVLGGSWSGELGRNREVTGTWRDGYVELTFPGEWPAGMIDGKVGVVKTRLAGWLDGASAKGRSRVEPRAEGLWTATRNR